MKHLIILGDGMADHAIDRLNGLTPLQAAHKPNIDLFKPWIDTDEQGYIITDGPTPRTNLPGVFAAGDVADPLYRQAINAAASGCRAAIEAERYMQTMP